jgi:hypothetical protein
MPGARTVYVARLRVLTLNRRAIPRGLPLRVAHGRVLHGRLSKRRARIGLASWRRVGRRLSLRRLRRRLGLTYRRIHLRARPFGLSRPQQRTYPSM